MVTGETRAENILLTSAQMRAIEGAAIDGGSVSGLELMERAGRGVVAATFREWPDLAAAPHKAVVFCGPGNNGGDGFVVARLLKGWGWEVEVLLYGDPERLPPDARANHDSWRERGGVGTLPGDFDAQATWKGADLAIDALFGTGLARPLSDLGSVLANLDDAADQRANGARGQTRTSRVPRVVAVDIPSGLDADSGRPLEPPGGEQGSARANLTVTFHSEKLGHRLARGPGICGKVVVADIGLRPAPAAGAELVRLVGPPSRARLSKAADHKYRHGHAVVVSGGMGRSGAARLAARGALRVGAGLVTVAAPGSAMMECAGQLTAIMLRRCDEAGDLAEFLGDDRLNAVCLGPGLGAGAATRDLVAAALAGRGRAAAGRHVVLDADALTAFAEDPGALFRALHPRVVLTPHDGEFARLFPDLAAGLDEAATSGPAYSRVDAAREAARRAGCMLLLKGPDTVIADASGRCAIQAAQYERSAPWMATAGAGDVLAGVICGLMARGLAAFEAAQAGAWLHVEAARAFGPGLIAEDIPETLPRVFRDLGL